MELLCDASYNERKNTVTFSNLKAKKKKKNCVDLFLTAKACVAMYAD